MLIWIHFKKWMLFAGILLAVMLVGLRICQVNADVKQPLVTVYREGEYVPLGEDYFYQEQEKSPGYEVKVISSEMKPFAAFVEEYGQTEDYIDEWMRATYVIDVKVTIKNTNTDEKIGRGIDLIDTQIQAVNDTIQVNNALFSLVEPKLSGQTGFRVRPGTEFTTHLPFMRPGYKDKYESESAFLGKDYYLLLSMYPTKKMIELNLGNPER